ncbi:MAG: hypothetical protein ACI4I0_05410 [Acutalibacteraceae bacterium]
MKRILPLIAVFLLLLPGCRSASTKQNERNSPPDLPTSFTSELYITHGTREYEANYIQRSLTDAELEFTAPATVKGLKVTLSGAQCTFSYGTLSFSADVSSLPQSGVGRIIAESVREAADTAATQTAKENGVWVTKGSISDIEFTLQRSDNGLPLRLEVPQTTLSVDFRNTKQ